MTFTTAEEELIQNAQFYPVFGPDGEFLDIQRLTVPTDRRLGVRAVEELMSVYEPGDEQLMQNGFTRRQLRIMSSLAPAAAHYLKPTKKYNADTGEMIPDLSIIIPYEVAWRLFEMLFEGQYSIDIKTVETHDEDVLSITDASGGDDKKKSDNAPGRIFYSRAHVTVTLHLGSGEPKRYTGAGVGYNYVREGKLGNVFAINSARRTVEKGAVSDAKREAVSNIGRVFRRAFEDGDEMVEKFRELLLARLKEANKSERPARAKEAETVAAPAPRKAGVAAKASKEDADKKTSGKKIKKASKSSKKGEKSEKKSEPKEALKESSEDEIPYEKFEGTDVGSRGDVFTVARDGKVIDQSDDPDLYFDRISDVLTEIENATDAKRLIDENSEDLERAETASKAGNTVLSLRDMAIDSLSSGGDDAEPPVVGAMSDEESADDENGDVDNWKINVAKPTGAAIIDGYKKLFAKAKSNRDVESILEVNTDLAKRLTKSQTATLLNETLKAKKKSG